MIYILFLMEQVREFLSQRVQIRKVALPDNKDTPSLVFELASCLFMSVDVLLKLLHPEVYTAFRGVCKSASRMPVPEAAVNEDHCLELWQDNIRGSGKRFNMQSEAVPHSVQQTSHNLLGTCVLRSDPGHVPASFLFRQWIRHKQLFPQSAVRNPPLSSCSMTS